MRRGLKVPVLSLAALALAAIAVVAPGPAPAQAGTGFLIFGGVQGSSGCALHGHAHGSHITVTCGGTVQAWVFANLQRWTNHSGQIVYVKELQVAGTNLCANWTPVDYNLYLNNCVGGDKNELFWQVPSDSNGDYWFINTGASDYYTGDYYYMTATVFTDNASVVAAIAGAGARAVWYLPY